MPVSDLNSVKSLTAGGTARRVWGLVVCLPLDDIANGKSKDIHHGEAGIGDKSTTMHYFPGYRNYLKVFDDTSTDNGFLQKYFVSDGNLTFSANMADHLAYEVSSRNLQRRMNAGRRHELNDHCRKRDRAAKHNPRVFYDGSHASQRARRIPVPEQDPKSIYMIAVS